MSTNQKYRADILIIGGGVAGLSLAMLLGKSGVKVHLVEPFPPKSLSETPISSRTVALMQSSLNVLRACGLDDFCEEYGTKMEVMRIIDDSISGQDTITSEFDSFDIGQPYFSMNIPNSVLRARLYEDATALKNITIHEGCSLEDYDVQPSTHVQARLSDESTIETPLIIGADGRSSLVRKIAGIKINKKPYGQSAITCVINHSKSHNNTSTEFHRPGGPFALVPMSGNQSSVVWVEPTDKADALLEIPKDAFEQALQEATNDILGAITLETPPQSWPLCAITAKSLSAPRVALIAEAAHVMSPITAQGLNLSLRDVATLAETIMDAMRVGSDHGSDTTLRRYEGRRKFDINTRTFGVNGMNQIVSNDKVPIKDLRRTGLKIVDRFSPLKMFAMQHGLAPSLDQGRILRGEKL
ncbi:MAG: FAD-dependent monooxygenase [Alphaproteobacteria bacterium]